jgi:hypothetical protein
MRRNNADNAEIVLAFSSDFELHSWKKNFLHAAKHVAVSGL